MRYDYFCPENGKTVEVNHSMTESLTTWGEVCEKMKIDPGITPLDAPVERIISGGSLTMIKGRQTWHSNPATDCMCNGDTCSMPNRPACCGGVCSHKS